MLGENRTYWLGGVFGGLVAGLVLVPLETLKLTAIGEFTFQYGTPALFGAVFVICLRSATSINWRRGLCFLTSVVAAHWSALHSAVHLGGKFGHGLGKLIGLKIWGYHIVGGLSYGLIFAFILAIVAAAIFPTARNGWLGVRIVVASGLVALSFWPLSILFHNTWISISAAGITFSLVYAIVAAFLGWKLLDKGEDENAYLPLMKTIRP